MRRIFSAILATVVLVFQFVGCSSNNDPQQSGSVSINFGWDASSTTTEEGSTARADEIQLKAMADAKGTGDESLLVVALDYLKEHSNNFYESNDVMEQSLYYGCFVYEFIKETEGASNISELSVEAKTKYNAGYYTVKAIKYVYRGVEKVEDESTQNALKKAQTALESL